MALEQEVARGKIVIDLDDRAAMAALERVNKDYDRTMRDIDRQDATVDIDIDTDTLKRDLKEAEREVKDYQKRIDESDNKRSKAQLARQKKLREATVERLKEEVYQAEKVQKYRKHGDKVLQQSERRLAAIAKQEAAVARIEEQRYRKKLAHATREERLADRAEAARVRELKQEEKIAAERQRELDALPRLRREYVQLAGKIERLQEARRKLYRRGDERALLEVDMQTDEAQHKFDALRNHLESEGQAIDVPLRFGRADRLGTELRTHLIRNHTISAGLAGAGSEWGGRLARSMSASFARRFVPDFRQGFGPGMRGIGRDITHGVAAVAARGGARLASLASNLSNMTIRLGPFTATIRQAMVAMTLLGPAIVSVVGALSAFVGVLGAATLGVGALALGFVGGLIPAVGGFFAIFKPVAAQFGEAMKASKAYRQEVLQSGKNSEEAKDKLKALEQVLGNVDKRTRQNFVAAGNLSERWEDLTKKGRASAFKIIGEGLKFASDNMGWFAKNTNQGMAALSDGVRNMLSNLDTNAFDTMQDNFNSAIRPMMAGVTNLINYFARVGAVASKAFTGKGGLANTFKQWSKGLLDTTKDADTFREKVNGVVEAAKDMGAFFMSFGRLMKAFFGGGVEEGTRFIETMTKAMDRWTEFLNTDEGQDKLHDFFGRSVDDVQSLFKLLAPLTKQFVQWATLMAPIAGGFFKATGAIAAFVNKLLEMTAFRGPVTALLATLGALWAVGKIGGAVAQMTSFTRALLGLAAAQRVVAASSAMTGAGGLLGALARGGGVAGGAALSGMAADIALMGRQADETAAKSRTLGSTLMTMGRAAGPLGLTALAVTGIFTAYKLFGNKAETVADQVNRLTEESLNYSERAHKGITSATGLYQNLAAATSRQHTATKSVAEAQAEVDRLTKAGKTNTEAYRQAILTLNDALRERKDATQDANKAAEALQKADDMMAESADAVRTASDGQKRAMEDIRSTLERTGSAWDASMFGGKRPEDINARDLVKYREEFDSLIDTLKADPNLAGIGRALEENLDAARAAMAALTRARGEDSRAARQQAVHAVNLKRALQEFAPLGRAAGEAMQQLTRSIGTKKTFEIAVKFPNPRQALNVMKAINNAIDQGVNKKRAINIALNSKTAEQALRRLDRLTIDDKDFRIVEQGGQKAIRLIEDILGKKLPPKTQQIIEKGGPRVVAMLQAIKDSRMPGKTQDIDEKGGSLVLRILGVLRNFDIGKAIKTITDSGTGGTVRGILTGLKLFNDLGTAVKHVRVEGAAAIAGIGGASGGLYTAAGGVSPTVARRQLALATSSGLPTIGAGTTQRGSKVRKPTLMVGEENRAEYVIATNPKYRKSNEQYLRMAAREFGMEFAAGGKPGLSKKDKNKYKKHGKAGNPSNLPEVKAYYALQVREEDTNREISIAESKVRRPDSLIREKGVNEWGEMEYEVDENAKKQFSDQLGDVLKKYALLTDPKTGIVAQMFKQAKKAYEALSKYRNRRHNHVDYWQGVISHYQDVLDKDGPEKRSGEKTKAFKARKEAARKRKEFARNQITKAKDEIRDQRAGVKDSRGVEKDIREDEKDLGYRQQEYGIAEGDVRYEQDQIAGQADEELKSAQPTAPEQGTAAEQKIGSLEAEKALAEAGMGLGGPGTKPRAMADILKELIGAQELRIGEAQGMLTDSNKYNDEEANAILAGAGSAIAGLKDELANPSGGGGGSGTSLPEQMYAYSQARGDMFRQFGSNFSNVSAWNAGSMLGSAYGRAPYAQPGGGGSTITINNTFPTPPADPHIWSQGIAYELGTL